MINGHAYNTEAATLVARRVQRVQMDGVLVGGVACEEADIVQEFYVTRPGEFFCLEMWNVLIDDPNSSGLMRQPKNEHITPISRQELELNLAKAEGLEMFSEAAVDAAAQAMAVGSIVHLRVPTSLRLRVEAAAKKAKLSSNDYVVRCLESRLREADAQDVLRKVAIFNEPERLRALRSDLIDPSFG
jgi:hypothetical protein